MNKAMIFPIHKKWVDMIFDGTKKFEFRTKLPKDLAKGTKIYFYEALGKKSMIKGTYQQLDPSSGINYSREETDIEYEGSGMIVGEATVGEIYEGIQIIDLDTGFGNEECIVGYTSKEDVGTQIGRANNVGYGDE